MSRCSRSHSPYLAALDPSHAVALPSPETLVAAKEVLSVLNTPHQESRTLVAVEAGIGDGSAIGVWLFVNNC